MPHAIMTFDGCHLSVCIPLIAQQNIYITKKYSFGQLRQNPI